MAEYSYRFANLLSDSDVAEIELSNVRFDRRIIQPGAFQATAIVTNLNMAEQVKKIIPARTVVHVYRDADIWGTYIIWSIHVRSSNRGPVTVDIQGSSLESWFYKRLLDVDLDFEDDDQFYIARTLVEQAQIGWPPYEDSANLNIITTSNNSGVLRDRSYRLTDAVSVGQRLEELANVDNGFEYYVSTYVDSETNMRVRKLILANELGQDIQESVFAYPGSILSYDIGYDATDAATAFWARGDTISDDVTSSSEPLMLSAPVLSSEYLENAFPHLDKVVNYSTVIVLDTLVEYATWWRDNRSGVWAVPVIEVNTTDVPTIITPTTLGSYAQFTILDEYFGLSDTLPEFSYRNRIVGIEVTPPQRGSAEKIRLVVEQAFDPTDIE